MSIDLFDDHSRPRKPNGLGSYLGRNDKAHVKAFVASSVEARRANPVTCLGVTKSPPHSRCQCLPLIGGQYCHLHMPIADVVRLDVRRREHYEKIARTSTWASRREYARVRLAAIERRHLRYTWATIDPYYPGATCVFSRVEDEQLCAAWLVSHGFDPYGVSPISGELVSARCRDRSMWAASKLLIKKNISAEHALAKVRKAHDVDRLWNEKLKRAAAGERINRSGSYIRKKKHPPAQKAED